MTIPMVEAEAVSKNFGRHQALVDVDFTVGRGDTVAIIGSSGSGKTTLLRCLNGLETISAGRITIDGTVLQRAESGKSATALKGSALRLARRSIGIVFQQYNLFPHLSALENISLAQTAVLKRSRAEAHERSHALLAKVGLANKAENRPSQLSGGQQQRVAIARALAMDPSLLLLDEITSALDPQMTGEVLRVVRQLADDGMTMVAVTHEMGFARHVASRIVVMADGQIVEEGKSGELLDNPKTEVTQRFLAASLDAS